MPKEKVVADLTALKNEIKFLVYDVEQKVVKQEHQILSILQEIFKKTLDQNKISVTQIIKYNFDADELAEGMLSSLIDLRELVKDIRNGNIDLLDDDCRDFNLSKLLNRLNGICEVRLTTHKNVNVSSLNESIKFVIFDIEILDCDEINEYTVLKDLVQIYSDAVEDSSKASMNARQVIRHNLDDCSNLKFGVLTKLDQIKSIVKDIKSCYIDLYSGDEEEKSKLLERMRSVQEVKIEEEAVSVPELSSFSKQDNGEQELESPEYYEECYELESPEYYSELESPHYSEQEKAIIRNRLSTKRKTTITRQTLSKPDANKNQRMTLKVTDNTIAELEMEFDSSVIPMPNLIDGRSRET